MGKGSRPRPVEKRKYDKNYDAINWECEMRFIDHPFFKIKPMYKDLYLKSKDDPEVVRHIKEMVNEFDKSVLDTLEEERRPKNLFELALLKMISEGAGNRICNETGGDQDLAAELFWEELIDTAQYISKWLSRYPGVYDIFYGDVAGGVPRTGKHASRNRKNYYKKKFNIDV